MSTIAPHSEQIRSRLAEALRLDLVGPANDHAFANELLPDSSRRWYLTGCLVPTTLPSEKKTEDEGVEEEIIATLGIAFAPEGCCARHS